ncbi:vps53-like domain protein [Trypanosoma rangeli]|uniref:Vps53-like domain protein n=1 Tax=Trypanosoma rangeli TaxID=5698 RepID=A0A3R7KBJ1_TRYRA|nr:vps53-like domain protein [Trypanosoma rangeli]RNF04870.1 vps53-like domain protein [Trypanosoma rangeli]|eukprot:RNF04870.1 vps53-like domain protein [Trypanosoma rangeli]
MPPVRFSDAVEKALAEVCPPRDPFDEPDFDPVGYLNNRFPDESSLAALPAFMEEMTVRLTKTENDLLKAVEAQATNAATADKELHNAKAAVVALYDRVSDIKARTAKSEDTVRELCHHIRELDTAKNNLTVSINTLRSMQLWMLQLQALSTSFESRKFIQCRDALMEAQKYSAMFESMNKLPKVREINDKQAQLCRQMEHYIRHTVFGDISLDSLDETLMAEACAVVDLLGKESIRKIRDQFIEKMLEVYSLRFKRGSEDAKLERTERRYVYIRNLLEQNKGLFLSVFPRHWCVPQELCVTFCLRTKTELDCLLHGAAGNIDVVVLTYVLQKTIDIERDLTRMMAWKEEFPGRSELPDYRYNGMILSSFKAHMDLFVRNEDKLMDDALSHSFMGSFTEVERGNSGSSSAVVGAAVPGWNSETDIRVGAILPVAEDLFIFIKESLKRTIRISQQDVLLDMAAVWRKHLIRFAETVATLLPSPAISKEDMRRACIIVNTADLCQSTIRDLGDEVCTRGETPAKEVGFDRVTEAFSTLYSKAIQCILQGTELNLTPFLVEYGNAVFVNRRSEEQDIHDESATIRSMSTVLHDMVLVCSVVLPSSILRFLLDKVAHSVIPMFTDTLYRMRRLPPDFALGLMRVDSAAFERTFLQLPNYNDPDRIAPAHLTGYMKLVRREFDRLNRALKVLQLDASVDSFVDVYYEAMLPEDRSIQNFVRLVELKGRKREDVRPWIAHLSKRGVVEATRRDRQREASLGIATGTTGQSSVAGATASGGLNFSNFFLPTAANTSEQSLSGGFSNAFNSLVSRAGNGGNAQSTATTTTAAAAVTTTTPRLSTGMIVPAETAEESFGTRFAKAARSTVTSMNFLSNFKKEGGNNSGGGYGAAK